MSQRIGNLPANINIMNPVPNKDAKTIMKLIRTNGKISGYQLGWHGAFKADGVALAKQGGIRGVAIASRNGSEYLRSIPDGKESNNLGDSQAPAYAVFLKKREPVRFETQAPIFVYFVFSSASR